MFIRYTIVLHELYDNALDSNNNRNSNNINVNENSNALPTTNDETIPLIYT